MRVGEVKVGGGGEVLGLGEKQWTEESRRRRIFD